MSQYPVISFNQYSKQDNTDKLHMFAAKSNDISKWAGIPRKGWKIRMLYQRWITDSRRTQLESFWKNASGVEGGVCTVCPSAIVVAIKGKPQIEKNIIDLDFKNPLFDINDDNEKLIFLANKILPDLKQRVGNENLTLLEEFEKSPDSNKLPKEKLDGVLEFCYQLILIRHDCSKFIEQYELTTEDIGELIASMDSISRPAVVIDGQHRLEGARMTDGENIKLPVVAIEDSSWTDQIFQFVIINDKARPIEPSILNDIFASSLTVEEQKGMRDVFRQNYIEIEIKIAAVLAGKDIESPFNGMVKLNLQGSPSSGSNGYISDRIIQALIDGGTGYTQKGFRSNPDFLKDVISTTFSNQEWDDWVDGKWRSYWFGLWHEFKDFYSDKAKKYLRNNDYEIWSKTEQTNITKGVGLKVFQTFIIERLIRWCAEGNTLRELAKKKPQMKKMLNEEADEYKFPNNVSDFRKLVREEIFQYIPVKVFTTPWKGSLDHEELRRGMITNLNEIFENEKATPKVNWHARGKFFESE